MLILTRRLSETIVIVLPAGTRLPDGTVFQQDELVSVSILGIKGNQVRVGVGANKHLQVHREEIYERIQREQEEVALSSQQQVRRVSGNK